MLFKYETTSFITHTFAFSRLLDWSSRRVLGRARGLDNDIGVNSNIVPGPDSCSLRDSYLGYSSYSDEKKVCGWVYFPNSTSFFMCCVISMYPRLISNINIHSLDMFTRTFVFIIAL